MAPLTTSREFCDLLKARGLNFFTGVPCSILKGVVREFERDPETAYRPAVREDDAIGLATGAFLAGRRPLVFMQNSGLGVCLNALTSLATIYRIPLLLLVAWRGYQADDAPEHLVMGEAMLKILRDVDIASRVLEPERVAADVEDALAVLHRRGLPTALILREGVLA